jgi:colanic acid/amylovoran biosynthesis glycosyltransferase
VRSRPPLPTRVFGLAVDRVAAWPLGTAPAATASERPRVGYYLWRFPSLTEPYIQREIGALRRAGLDIEVFADQPEQNELLDADARAFAAGTHYLLLLDAARLRRHRRRVLRRQPLAVLECFAHVALHRYRTRKSPREDLRRFHQAVSLAGFVLERGVTHLHSPWAHGSASIASLAARMAGISYSVQARASADLYRRGALGGLGERVARAEFIVTGSVFNRAFIERAMVDRRPVPVHVVYEGLDPSRFVPAPTRASPNEPLRILGVGRLSEEKGFEHLLQALAIARARGRALRCVIVGGAEGTLSAGYDRRLVDLRRRLQLEDIVRFTGALPFDRVLEEYARADVFAMSSVLARDGGRDVTPNALIEAMAMQLAVVATNMTAIPEIVEHRVSGILVPPRNPPALAAALIELADDRALVDALGRNARTRVEQRFDVTKNARRYLELFGRV